MKRRNFILGSAAIAGLGASAYLGNWWTSKVQKHDASDIIQAVIKKKLPYLKISEKDIVTFSIELSNYMPKDASKKAAWIGIAEPLYSRLDLFSWSDITKRDITRFEEYVVEKFLMSTDFFQNHADESRRVNYISLYDPYLRPCTNPFAQLG